MREGNEPIRLSEFEAKRRLAKAGFTVPRGRVVAGAEEAGEAAAELAPPYVVKVSAPDVLHKSALGGVALGLGSAAEVTAAVRGMVATVPGPYEGFLVEEQAPGGPELFVSCGWDEDFGQFTIVGAGGTDVEATADVAVALGVPTAERVRRMLGGLRSPQLRDLAGRADVADFVLQLAGADGFFTTSDELSSLELNPVRLTAGGPVVLDAVAEAGPRPEYDDRALRRRDLTALYEPRSVAVVGASGRTPNLGNVFLRAYRDGGFAGPVHAVHPTAEAVDGFPAVASFQDIPGSVDYAVVVVPAGQVLDVLADGRGRVAVAQVVSSGFAETDARGEAVQSALRAAAAAAGTLVAGPNCIGAYSPRGRQTFTSGVTMEPGGVGAVMQSGGFAGDLIRDGELRGARFSRVLSIGNAVDLGLAEAVADLLHDEHTRVIGCYVESAREAWALREVIAAAPHRKPVVLLRGGRTGSGQRAIASHTGSFTGAGQFWDALVGELSVIETDDLEAFVDALVLLGQYPDSAAAAGTGSLIIGTGGGNSVIAADQLAAGGLEPVHFGEETRAALEALALPPGCGLTNPIDIGGRAMALRLASGDVPSAVVEAVLGTAPPPGDVLFHFNTPHLPAGSERTYALEELLDAIGALRHAHTGIRFAVVLRSLLGGVEEGRAVRLLNRAAGNGLPVYTSIPAAARALCRTRPSGPRPDAPEN